MKGKADQEKLAHPSYVGRPAAPRVFLPRQILHIVLLCVGLVASRASAEPLSLDANTQPQPTPSVKSTGAPVLGEAENATPNAVSLNAEGPSSAAASSILINPKSAKSDQNCLATAAATHDLPLDFFVRLIRQESNFDPNSVSHAGAQGIAQFMPGTARCRGLTDPFEPLQALYESARWLRELREQFGNLGLAAAAYNARPRRVQDWLAGRGGLPGETRAYEFDRRGRADINSVQALLLYNIGDKELTASELRTRGYYLGSNVSYNLKNWSNSGSSIISARASIAVRSASA